MRLHDLKPRPGSKHRRKRLGQGESSGHGKTSGRGGKGQTARSGSSIRIGFEGGQMPLIRRIPKRGFNNARFAVRYIPVNLESLNHFQDGTTVDESTLRGSGIANGRGKKIKILGDGELTRKLTVKVHAFSATARAKIEKLGGVCELIIPPAQKGEEKSESKRAIARVGKARKPQDAPPKAEAEAKPEVKAPKKEKKEKPAAEKSEPEKSE